MPAWSKTIANALDIIARRGDAKKLNFWGVTVKKLAVSHPGAPGMHGGPNTHFSCKSVQNLKFQYFVENERNDAKFFVDSFKGLAGLCAR